MNHKYKIIEDYEPIFCTQLYNLINNHYYLDTVEIFTKNYVLGKERKE